MDRRSYFAATGAAVTSVAGCTDLVGDSGSSDGDRTEPEQVVAEYYEALDDGDAERIAELAHSDSPQPVFENFDEVAGIFEEASLTLEETEVVEDGEDRVVVDSTYKEESQFAEDGEATLSDEIILRRENGEWKIWDDRGFQ